MDTSQEEMVFVVDDEPSVRKSLERLLQARGHRTKAFASVADFLKHEHYEGVGCLVLDVYLPDVSGLEAIAKLQEANYHLPIVFITGDQDIKGAVIAMKRGAVDYLVKSVDVADLLRAVAEALLKARQSLTIRSELNQIKKRLVLLTPREFEVLRSVVSGQLNKQIAFRFGLTEKTIKVHRSSVMRKMQAKTFVDLVRAADKAEISKVGEGHIS